MAIAIKTIPVLRNKVASAFVAQADKNAQKAKVDFTSQVASANKILSKAKI